MSLFPAYSASTSKSDEATLKANNPLNVYYAGHDNSDYSWLKNTSFAAEGNKPAQKLLNEECQASKSECGRDRIKKSNAKRKKKSDKRKNSLRSQTSNPDEPSPPASECHKEDTFYEDKKQEKGNFQVDMLYRPAIPRYDKSSRYFKVYKQMKKKMRKDKKLKRYYLMNEMKQESCLKEEDESLSKEEELSKVTEDFNKKLFENPRDIDTWVEYVRFQKSVYEFEKRYRNNPTGGVRVMSERQLAILERALQSNPANEQLMTMRLQLLELTQPPDKVAEECSRALVQDPGCLPMWRALVRTCRNNMARCVVPTVLLVFTKALSRLGQLRAHRPPTTVDKDILALVLECGLFLQQAGLWEQLMMLLQMYISLNLTASGHFTLPNQPQEDKLRQQEDAVLASGLPLSVLWLRIEKLRAAYHYLPLTDCPSDPQRVVFSQDLAGVLQPVTGGEMCLRLVATVFLLLKVPMLPIRHSVCQCLGLHKIPSAINNVETLLSAAYPAGFSSLSSCKYLSGGVDLLSEPQFVRDWSGQSEFLSSVVSLLQHCAELLPPADAVTVHVWLLRLFALLCRLHTLRLAAVPAAVVKQARSHAKQLLKRPQFRDNLLLYTEYAMIERALGDLDRACKVLETASALPTSRPEADADVQRLPNCHEERDADVQRLLLARRLAECLLLSDYQANKDAAVRVLTSVQWSATRWQQSTAPLASQPLTLSDTVAPQPLVEGLTCHALYLSLTCSVWDATALLQQHIDTLPHSDPSTLGSNWKEQLYEVLTGLLYLHTVNTKSGFTTLRLSLDKALSAFPNNLTLLNTLACLETSDGGGGSPLWKLVSCFPSSVPLARLLLVFVVRHRISLLVDGGGGNYLRNLLRQLSAEDETGQCPLMWRLHLQFVAAHQSEAEVKATFYKALQTCPWVKTLYLDAVKFLPDELSEVQDLLIEKELRLHTTPEELEILRE